MASLPMNRTRLNAAIANQQPSIIAASQANREAHIEAADTIDFLYNYVGSLIAAGTLQPYPFGVNRQALINSGFAVNQRAKSGTVTLAAGVYGHDRWKAGAAGCTYAFSTVENVTTITITAGSLVQVIEGIHLYTGTYTLSWTGSAQGKIGAGAYGATGITGAVTGGTNLSIEFGVGTLSNAQFNFGNSSVSYQPRPLAEELVLCMRYYEKSYGINEIPGVTSDNQMASGIAFSTTAINAMIQYKARKRITTPTITIYAYDGTANRVSNYASAGNLATTNNVNASKKTDSGFNGLEVVSGATNFTVGNHYWFSWVADAEI